MTTTLTTTPASRSLQTEVNRDWRQTASDWLNNFGSDRTREAYRDAWSIFLDFAQTSPDRVTKSAVIDFKRHLETMTSPRTGRPYTQSTINLRLSAIASFYTWAVKEGLRADNPTEGVNRKAVDPYGKATWLDPEAGDDLRLLSSIDATTLQGKRDRAIVLTFLTLGLRVNEVAGLTVGQLRRQADHTFLTYTRKRGKTKTIEIPRVTTDAIDAYLKTRSNVTDASPLFTATVEGHEAARRMLAAKGHDLADAEATLTDRAIAYLIKSYCDKTFGKGHGIHPHSLRHTAAKAAEVNGATLTDIGDLLGHASTRVTSVYMHATRKAADKVAARLGDRYATPAA